MFSARCVDKPMREVDSVRRSMLRPRTSFNVLFSTIVVSMVLISTQGAYFIFLSISTVPVTKRHKESVLDGFWCRLVRAFRAFMSYLPRDHASELLTESEMDSAFKVGAAGVNCGQDVED